MNMDMRRTKTKTQQYVDELMDRKGEVQKAFVLRSESQRSRNATSIAFLCPRGSNCKSGGEILAMKRTGFSNAYIHLKTCVADVNEDVLHLHYEDAMRNTIFTGNTFTPAREMMQATPRESTMFSWIEFITDHSLPICYIQ